MRKVFLDELPRYKGQEGRINWKESIGYKIPFIYDDIEGELLVVDYTRERQKITLKYKDNTDTILTNALQKCHIGRVLNQRTGEFKIEIGTPFKDNRRDIIVTDREIRDGTEFRDNDKAYIRKFKYYKYKCNICGYDEGWIEESQLRRGGGCACCHGKPVLGINTIYDKAPWMIDLGVSEEDAKRYAPQSNDKILVVCPHCGKEKYKSIPEIYKYKSIGCRCGDNFSYGHKYVFALLSQLNIKFIDNVKPSWCKFYNPFREKDYSGEYDFIVEDLKLIIEVDGRFHREDNNLSGQSKKESEFIDSQKDRLAEENGYELIRIFYDSDNTEIESHIKSSELIYMFDLSCVDYNKCERFAIGNIIKNVCDYWKNKQEHESTISLEEIFNISSRTIVRYLKKGTKLGWCHYDPKEEFNKSRIRSGITNAKILSKEVEMFKDGKSLGVFESVSSLARQSEALFGTKLCDSKISAVCNGKRKTHKGFTFKYTNNNNNKNNKEVA